MFGGADTLLKPLTIHIHGKPVELTGKTLEATYQWYADNCRACAKAAQAGEFLVNNLELYVSNNEADAKRYEALKRGEESERMSLAFIQQAYYIQSGESVPMLAK